MSLLSLVPLVHIFLFSLLWGLSLFPFLFGPLNLIAHKFIHSSNCHLFGWGRTGSALSPHYLTHHWINQHLDYKVPPKQTFAFENRLSFKCTTWWVVRFFTSTTIDQSFHPQQSLLNRSEVKFQYNSRKGRVSEMIGTLKSLWFNCRHHAMGTLLVIYNKKSWAYVKTSWDGQTLHPWGFHIYFC